MLGETESKVTLNIRSTTIYTISQIHNCISLNFKKLSNLRSKMDLKHLFILLCLFGIAFCVENNEAEEDLIRNEGHERIFVHAAANDHMDVVKLMLDDLNVSKQAINTAMMSSCFFGRFKMVSFLLQNGAEINNTDCLEEGSPALLFAVEGNKIDVAALLLRKGADANIVNNEGLSPLMQAVMNENVEMMRLLISHGADLHSNAIPASFIKNPAVVDVLKQFSYDYEVDEDEPEFEEMTEEEMKDLDMDEEIVEEVEEELIEAETEEIVEEETKDEL
eukprot:TRINITY_DN776054_c0_g1_i1.p1 TRINITY_DN776054_c0_g1~~TRINITY_DN776054_c0_g1_i1.p1  ORF type:complete len:287 (+),score=87.19 TRINITY_DN776054_c0_g1_i1:32-862(+)